MAFTPPNTFTGATTLTSSAMSGNLDALKVYLHDGVVAGDLLVGKFIDSRHVLTPEYDAIQGLQNGVSGMQGGQWSGGASVRVTFSTSMLTGRRYTGSQSWAAVPGTAFKLELRAAATCLFHWFVEVEAGPDDGSRGPGTDARYAYFAPYVGNLSLISTSQSQEVVNNYNGWEAAATAKGAQQPYTYIGWGNLDGVHLHTTTGPQMLTVGLGTHSNIDRVAVLNWGVAVEITYI